MKARVQNNHSHNSLFLILNRITKIERRDLLIIAVSFCLLSIGSALLFKSAEEWVFWLYDDTEHLSVAYNFYHNKGLTKDSIDIEANSKTANLNALASYDSVSQPLRSKPPLHLILLGAWLYLTNATFNNWRLLGAVFNFILCLISIFIFYFFVKKYFKFEIAAYSTLALALVPSLIWHSVRIRPEILAFIFSLLSLYYAAGSMKLRNVLLAAMFVGLSHLTHPIGLVTGGGLIIYYLIHRSIKQAVLLVAIWTMIILPWMIRNYMIFGDATQGLGIPLPRSLLLAIGLINPGSGPFSNIIGNTGGLSLTVANVPLYSTISGMLNEFSKLYGMQFFIFFISFSILAFISFSELRKALLPGYLKIATFGILLALYIRAVLFAVSLNTRPDALAIQAVVLFLVPLALFLYIKLFTKYKNVIMTKQKPIYQILAITGILTFVPYLLYAQITGRIVPEVRIVVYGLYLLIPLAIIGLKKFIILISKNLIRDISERQLKAVLAGILAIIIIPQMILGIDSINSFQLSYGETPNQKAMHSWINQNIPKNSVIATELPHVLLLRTGLPSVNFFQSFKDDVSYERWIIKKFDVDYLVFYYPSHPDSVPLRYTTIDDLNLIPVYQGSQSIIYKVESDFHG